MDQAQLFKAIWGQQRQIQRAPGAAWELHTIRTPPPRRTHCSSGILEDRCSGVNLGRFSSTWP